ncbi:MAG: hypothetical protein WCD18_17395 [Thermosynechococcaceae cyanobacterium]
MDAQMQKRGFAKISLALASLSVATLAVGISAIATHAQAPTPLSATRGVCSKGSRWNLNATRDNRLIEVDYEVIQGVIGQRWNVQIKHNSKTVYSAIQKTVAPDGSFTVKKRYPNLVGVDTFFVKSTNLKTAEVCKGSLNF